MPRIEVKGVMELDGSGWDRTIRQSEERITHFSNDTLGELKRNIAAAFTVGAIVEMYKSATEFGHQIEDASSRMGASTDTVQEFGYAARQAGGDLGVMETAMDKLAKAMQEALSGTAQGNQMAETLNALGVASTQFADAHPDEALRAIGEQLEKTGANAQTTAAMMQVFGRAGGQLIPILSELRKKSDEAHQSGLIMNSEELDNLKQANQILDSWSTKLKVMTADAAEFWKEFADKHRWILDILSGKNPGLAGAHRKAQEMEDSERQSHEDIMNSRIALRKWEKAMFTRTQVARPGDESSKEDQDAIKNLHADTARRRAKRKEAGAGTLEQQIAAGEKNLQELQDALKKPHSQLAGASLENQIEVQKDALKGLYKQHLDAVFKKPEHPHGERLPVNEQMKTGNFLGANGTAVSTIWERQLHTQQLMLAALNRMVNGSGSSPTNTNGSTGVPYP